MSLAEVQKAVEDQLDRNPRGDYGWWLVTRIHLTPGRLRAVVDYIFDIGGDGPVEMTPALYRNLGNILDIKNEEDPAVTINRHIFLAMQTPLGLIERTDGRSWSNVQLTSTALRLRAGSDPSTVFEPVLRAIRFCKEPWFTAERVQKRKDFDVHPYLVTLDVLRACGGRIDIDEFDLFVSRIRSSGDVAWAVANIQSFRLLSPDERALVLRKVKDRTPEGKPYSNWRDMARHTFSLFSLGTSALRDRNELFLSDGIIVEAEPAAVVTEPAKSKPTGRTAVAGSGAARMASPKSTSPKAKKPRPALKLPHVEAPPELLIPPVQKAFNTGDDAEILIGKMFAASGWTVVYYGQRRGYGFDIWVRKGDAAFVIEVKSGTGQVSSLSLTQTEHEAATAYGKNFLIAVVEHIGSSEQEIYIVDDPVPSVGFVRIEDHKYRSSGDWRAISKRYEDVS